MPKGKRTRTRNSSPLVIASALLIFASAVCGCNKKEVVGADLRVAQMSKDDARQIGYLALNEDKPGAEVDYQEYLVPGKYTVIYFFSPYDEITPRVGEALKRLPEVNRSVAVRTVNVNRPEVEGIDWDSAVVYREQISQLPYVQIFETNQKLRAHGRPAWTLLQEWLEEVPSSVR